MRAGLAVQTLQYYYYITVYNGGNLNRDQKIQVYLLTNNGTSSPIHTITIANMTSNSWQNINVQIMPPVGNYTVTLAHLKNNLNLLFFDRFYSVLKLIQQVMRLTAQFTLHLMTS
jgi:hypothetical protein